MAKHSRSADVPAKNSSRGKMGGGTHALGEAAGRRERVTVYGWALAVTAVLLLILFVSRGIYPFGDKVLQYADGDQNLGFTGYLQSTLFTDNDLLYSWSLILGGSPLGAVAFYAGSVFNILIVLFPGHLMLGYHVILAVKFLAAALTFAVMAVEIFQSADRKAVVLFSASYPFIGYMTYFIWQQSWLDGVVFLPLIVLGIWRILKDDRPLLYTISLAVLLLSSYYIGYMVCLASALMFVCGVVLVFPRWNSDILRKTSWFVAATAVAIGLAAVVLIPAFLSLPEYRKTAGGDLIQEITYASRPAEVLSMLYTAPLENLLYKDNYPIIYTGIVQLVLGVIFFLHRQISRRLKAVAGVLLLVLTLSFLVSALNIVWHGFSQNVWYNFRYSFVFSFILELLALHTFLRLDGATETLPAAGAILAALTAFALGAGKENIGAGTLLLDAAAIAAALLLLLVYISKRSAGAAAGQFTAFLLIAVLALGTLSYNSYKSTEGRGYINEGNNGLGDMAAYTAATERERRIMEIINDPGFYRRASTSRYGRTDALLFGYAGISNFNSAEDRAALDAVNRLGLWYQGHEAVYTANVPIATDALLGVRYVVVENDSFKADWMTEKGVLPDTNLVVLENSYALPLLFPSETVFDEQGTALNTINLLNGCWNSIEAEGGNVFEILDYTSEMAPASDGSVLTIHFRALSDGPVYVYVPEGDYSADFPLPSNNQDIFWLGNFTTGQEGAMTLHMGPSYQGWEDIAVGTERTDVLAEKASSVQSRSGEVQMEKSSSLWMTYAAETDVMMASTIPFDANWHVYVDGAETETYRNLNWFLAFDVPAGQHEIVLKYWPVQLGTGAAVSVAALAILLAYALRRRIMQRFLPAKAAARANSTRDGRP